MSSSELRAAIEELQTSIHILQTSIDANFQAKTQFPPSPTTPPNLCSFQSPPPPPLTPAPKPTACSSIPQTPPDPPRSFPPILHTTHSTSLLPIRRLSPSEIQEKNDRGLCYNCDQTWSDTHRCRSKYLILFGTDDDDDDSPDPADMTVGADSPPLSLLHPQPPTLLSSPHATPPPPSPPPSLLHPQPPPLLSSPPPSKPPPPSIFQPPPPTTPPPPIPPPPTEPPPYFPPPPAAPPPISLTPNPPSSPPTIPPLHATHIQPPLPPFPQPTEVASTQPTQSPTPLLPIKIFSPPEIEEKRDRDLCYNCDRRWSPTHRCRLKIFLLMGSEDDGEAEPPDPTSIVGDNSRVSNTLNFIHSTIVGTLKLLIREILAFRIFVGNGDLVGCTGEPPPTLTTILSHLRARVSVEMYNWVPSKDEKPHLIFMFGSKMVGPNEMILAAQIYQFLKIDMWPIFSVAEPMSIFFEPIMVLDGGPGPNLSSMIFQGLTQLKPLLQESSELLIGGQKVQLCGEPPPATPLVSFLPSEASLEGIYGIDTWPTSMNKKLNSIFMLGLCASGQIEVIPAAENYRIRVHGRDVLNTAFRTANGHHKILVFSWEFRQTIGGRFCLNTYLLIFSLTFYQASGGQYCCNTLVLFFTIIDGLVFFRTSP